jgi:Cu/Zn superoxide dismutase
MKSRIITAAIAIASIGTFTACGSDTGTTVAPSVTYVSTLSGANEVPPRATTATGTATYTLTGNILAYTVTVNGLTGAATASHIHAAPAGTNGNVIVPYVTANVVSGVIASGSIDLSQPISNGTTSITGDSLRTLLNNGGAYTNVHTPLFGGGEIRGQIIKQ